MVYRILNVIFILKINKRDLFQYNLYLHKVRIRNNRHLIKDIDHRAHHHRAHHHKVDMVEVVVQAMEVQVK
jgi:hypothetical protein